MMMLIRRCLFVLMITTLVGCERKPDAAVTSNDDPEVVTEGEESDEPAMPEGEPSVPESEHRAVWVVESIGPVKIDMPSAKVADAVGTPNDEMKPTIEGATGDHVTTWSYDGVTVGFRGESEKGPWVVNSVSVEAPSDWKTERGIGIGSSRKEVEQKYAGEINESEGEGGGPEDVVVGTIYGGVIFDFTDDKVSRIFVGAAAE